jgi:hypothetical protein
LAAVIQRRIYTSQYRYQIQFELKDVNVTHLSGSGLLAALSRQIIGHFGSA